MKTNIIKMLCVIIASVMVAGVFPASADESSIITGTFMYMSSFDESAASETYYYSDDYFTLPSSQRNQHLITMSMALALSTMETGGSTYVTKLLKDIGYTDIQIDDMDSTPTKDTIGTAIAHKKIQGKDVLAVAIRGSKYNCEWVSNLTAGSSGDIKGFHEAAEKVISRLKEYIALHELEDIKLWVTGYSRAGGVSDLVGVYINEHPDEFAVTADDVYVYPFAAPRCCESSKIYNNIYCIKNKNDVINYVYPQSWGLYTNGVDIIIGEDKTVHKTKIDILNSNPTVDLGEGAMNEFVVEFIEFISEDLNREVFSGDFDDALADLIELYFSKPLNEWERTFDYLKNDYITKVKSNSRFLYVVLVEINGGIMRHNSDKMYEQLANELLLVLDETTTADELNLTDKEYQIIRDNLYPILRAVGPFFVKDYLYKLDADYGTLLPSDYNDPDYDPQTSEKKILTYNQCFHPLGAVSGEDVNTDDQVSDPKQEDDKEYQQGFSDADQYACKDAQTDALIQQYKENYNEAPITEDVDSVISESYIRGYRDGYNESYDKYYNYYLNYFNERTLYHFGTFFVNLIDIVTEHYPKTNWKLVTSMDSYYTREVPVDTPDNKDNTNSYVLGDINQDGTVTAKDSMIIQRHVVNIKKLDDTQINAADVNNDGKITAKDALEILRYTIHMSKNDRIGQIIA